MQRVEPVLVRVGDLVTPLTRSYLLFLPYHNDMMSIKMVTIIKKNLNIILINYFTFLFSQKNSLVINHNYITFKNRY